MANEDTMLRTQMFPCLPMRTTFVVDTKFVSETQKMFLIFVRNILCPHQMFPCLRGMETNVLTRSFAHPRNIMSNNVSSFATTLRDWFKNLVPVVQPIRSQIKTNWYLLRHIYLCFMILLVFALFDSWDCLCQL